MDITEEKPSAAMYYTTNTTYGTAWQSADAFDKSFTQTQPYKQLTNRRQVRKLCLLWYSYVTWVLVQSIFHYRC